MCDKFKKWDFCESLCRDLSRDIFTDSDSDSSSTKFLQTPDSTALEGVRKRKRQKDGRERRRMEEKDMKR